MIHPKQKEPADRQLLRDSRQLSCRIQLPLVRLHADIRPPPHGTLSALSSSTSWRSKNPPEHANLIDNVIPITRRLELVRQEPVQLLTHLNDSPSHSLDVAFPLIEQLRVIEDQRHLYAVNENERRRIKHDNANCDAGTHNTSAVCRRVAYFAPRKDGQLALDTRRSLFCRRHDVEGTYTLTVETSVFGEALSRSVR